MEPAGLAVGAVALVSLFGTCLDTLDRFDDYKNFATDSHHLVIQFEADKLRFEKWGRTVGIDQDKASGGRHKALEDSKTYTTVANVLSTIRGLENDVNGTLLSSASGLGAEAAVMEPKLLSRSKTEPYRNRLKWALRDKTKRMAQVEYFGKLVQSLHNLVPLEETKDLRTGRDGREGREGPEGPTGNNSKQT
jgi:hypothetical protein